jgi:glyoxylase-like metal-dependent hydrolase (beta-lactamase superfamily II)
VSEFPNFVPRLPDMTFEREMNLNLGNRPVEIKYLGRGNTPGDVVVFRPKERILITGDIVVHPIPHLCSGYPSEWVQTLGRLIDLDPQTIIPGHGDVLHDLTYPRRVQKLLSDVVAEVRHSLYEQGNGKPLDDIRKQVEREMNFDSFAANSTVAIQATSTSRVRFRIVCSAMPITKRFCDNRSRGIDSTL